MINGKTCPYLCLKTIRFGSLMAVAYRKSQIEKDKFGTGTVFKG